MSVSTWMHFYDIPKFDELMRRVLKVNIDNVVTRVPEVIKKIAQSHSAFSSYATEEMLERHLFHPFRIQWGVAARDLGTSLSLMKHKKQNDSSYATTSLLNKIEIQMKDFLNPGNKVTLPSENDKPEEVKDFRHPIIAYFERILEEESNHRIKNPEKEQERQLRIPFIVQLIDIIEGDMKSGIIEETPGLISPELRMQIQNVNSTTVKPEGISIFVRDAIYKTPR
ncbi:MAG: hypothetical protein CL678_10555 [Bdellovibrionaceae bacterium]|nr:hypothetical protein [Pseudobdellovibrionaceae bacterium]